LAQIHDRARLWAELDLALDPNLDKGDLRALLFSFADEPARAGLDAWLRVHLDALLARLPPPGELSLANFLGEAAIGECDPARRDATAAWVEAHFRSRFAGDRIVKQQLERLDQCIERRRLVEPSLRAWLAGK